MLTLTAKESGTILLDLKHDFYYEYQPQPPLTVIPNRVPICSKRACGHGIQPKSVTCARVNKEFISVHYAQTADINKNVE